VLSQLSVLSAHNPKTLFVSMSYTACMTLRQMEYLLAVVDEGSFTRAAERLFVSQPALSHQVKALEQSVGGPLLERRPQAVHLTPLGRAFLPHATAAVRAAEDARRAARAVGQLESGELR